ncbi:MAG TPA: serine hydrolase [Clostridiales bacterium]|nr:serine hydrolase [Clostridiales bacterium]
MLAGKLKSEAGKFSSKTGKFSMVSIYRRLMHRYAHRIKVFFVMLILCLISLHILAAPFACAAHTIQVALDDGKPESPIIKAPSAILVEAERGQILYKKQADKKLHISTANKIMTAILAIEKNDLGAKVTISKESSSSEGSLLFLAIGEKYTVEDLLNAIIITNANDAANALAEYAGGDINMFVEMMNKKAQALNMQDTNFTNPTGLYDSAQYSTAKDIAVLIRYALSLPDFNRIISYRAVPWVDKQGVDLLTNTNKLFWSYDGVDGGKTGFNNKEQQTAITAATRNNIRLISIVLDAPENSVFSDSSNLLDYGFNNFKKGILVSKSQDLKSISVGSKEIKLISANDVYYIYPVGENYVRSISFNIVKDFKPPITRNSLAGIAHYTLKDGTVIDVNLYPETDILPPEKFYTKLINKLKESKDLYILVIMLIIMEILIMFYKIGIKISRISNRRKNGPGT